MTWISRCSLILVLLSCSTTPQPAGCVRPRRALPREISVGPHRVALDAQFDSGAFRVSRFRNRYLHITHPVSSQFDSVLVDVGPDGRVGGLVLVLDLQRSTKSYLEEYTRRYGQPITGATDLERGGAEEDYTWWDDRTQMIFVVFRPRPPEFASAHLILGNVPPYRLRPYAFCSRRAPGG